MRRDNRDRHVTDNRSTVARVEITDRQVLRGCTRRCPANGLRCPGTLSNLCLRCWRHDRKDLVVETEVVAIGLNRHLCQRFELHIGGRRQRRQSMARQLRNKLPIVFHPCYDPELPCAVRSNSTRTRIHVAYTYSQLLV